MNTELEKNLLEKYPKLFRTVKHLECSDGWYDILNIMCKEIQTHITYYRNNAARTKRYNRALTQALRGNYSNIEYYHRNSKDKEVLIAKDIEMKNFRSIWIENIPSQMQFTQIKEKFGTLRIYTIGGDAFCEGLVRMAEAISAKTCEECGHPGKQTASGWIRTLCKVCMENKNAK